MKPINPQLLVLVMTSGLLLTGCENTNFTASSCAIDETNTQPTSINCSSPQGASLADLSPEQEVDTSIGLSGQVFASDYWVDAKVCIDTNLNAQCDDGLEISVFTDDQGKYVFSEPMSRAALINKAPLIATLQNKFISASIAPLITESNFTTEKANISPFTSLLVNEMLFNEDSYLNQELALIAIQDDDFVLASDDVIAGSNYLLASSTAGLNTHHENLIASFIDNQNRLPDSGYKLVAALSRSMRQSQSSQVNISQADINIEQPLNDTIIPVLSANTLQWSLDYEDEKSRTMSSFNNLSIIGSKWHNRLTLLDTRNDQPHWISSTNFSYVEGGKDQIDAFTGATEQLINDIEISPDNRSVFVSIKKVKDNSSDKGVGIYRADIFDPHNIEEKKFAHDQSNNTDYYALPDINMATLSADGDILALASEKRKIVLLNANQLTERLSIATDSKVRSLSFNKTSDFLIAGLSRSSRTGLASFNVETGEEVNFIATPNYPVDIQLNNNLLATYFYQDNHLSLYDISNPEKILLLKKVPARESITSFSISSDGKLAALAMNAGKIDLYQLSPSIRLIKQLESKDASNINSLNFITDNKLIISIDNAVQTMLIDITELNSADNKKVSQ